MTTLRPAQLIRALCFVALLSYFPVRAQTAVSLRLSSSGVLTVSGNAGIYEIQCTTNLGPEAAWLGLDTITISNSPVNFIDAAGTSATQQFYRTMFLSMIASNGPANPAPKRWAWIPPGTFSMGSPTNELGRDEDEVQHVVTLTRGYFISKYETTQREYLRVMSNNPSWFSSSSGYPEDLDRPVEWVSWREATNYCGRLSGQEQAAGRLPAGWIYRLPTEAEWEYACRAGTTTPFHYGAALRSGMANFDGRYEYPPGPANTNGVSLMQTTTVGRYQPNGWRIHDLHGSVFEWCQDWYGGYPEGNATDPAGPTSGLFRVLRGGAWEDAATNCRSAYRDMHFPTTHNNAYGFRPVLAPGP